MTATYLSADSKVILLLCGTFGQVRTPSRPLSVTEYSHFAQWLHQNNMRPEDLLSESSASLLDTYSHKKVTPTRLRNLLNRSGALALSLENWGSKGIWVISRSDAAYPKRLKTKLKHLAPPILYGSGDKSLLNLGGIGIVGSRNVDQDGLRFTHEIAKISSQNNVQVISGGARGVDTEGMLSALKYGGTAVGILGHGLMQATLSGRYRNYLANKQLSLISTYHPEAGFSTGAAMGRNKYIYVLSNACLIVASDMTGGTWSGANENLKNAWVPLLVRFEKNIPSGNKRLIELGGIKVSLEHLSDKLKLAPTMRFTDFEAAAQAKQKENLVSQASLFSSTNPEKLFAPESAPETRDHNHSLPSQPETQLKNADLVKSAQLTTDNSVDIFDLIWPYFAQVLLEPRTPDELADRFSLTKKQTKDWLEKALNMGRLRKLTRPVRYQLSQS